MLKAAAEPAITSAPRELMADCTRILETENSTPCRPAGRPMRTISRHRLLLSFRSEGTTLRRPLSRTRYTNSMAELTTLERTVASATPATSIFSTMTKNRFSTTFSRPENVRQNRGVLVLP